MTSVLVSHPHVAPFSEALATSLASKNGLAQYMTGVAFSETSRSGRLAARWATKHPMARNRIVDVPPDLLRDLPVAEIGARIAGRVLQRLGFRLKPYVAIFATHDLAVSLVSWPEKVSAVYAYEDAALRTFQRAERLGLARIWDLPIPHYATIEDLLRQEAHRWDGAQIGPSTGEPDWKRRRKDAELALATKVSVASAFTKQSLERTDLRAPVTVVPYGFPLEDFALRKGPPNGAFTVLAVGTHDLRKGTPYLLEAWRCAAIPGAELHLVGPLRLAKSFVDRYAGLFIHHPYVPKANLPSHYAGADLLAFPTLGDGFGLVIQEAMCTGTPVLTTPCGGGPECITDGVDGWIVPPRDVDALVERLRAAASDRDGTVAVGLAARSRAERWTWRDSGDALIRGLEL